MTDDVGARSIGCVLLALALTLGAVLGGAAVLVWM